MVRNRSIACKICQCCEEWRSKRAGEGHHAFLATWNATIYISFQLWSQDAGFPSFQVFQVVRPFVACDKAGGGERAANLTAPTCKRQDCARSLPYGDRRVPQKSTFAEAVDDTSLRYKPVTPVAFESHAWMHASRSIVGNRSASEVEISFRDVPALLATSNLGRSQGQYALLRNVLGLQRLHDICPNRRDKLRSTSAFVLGRYATRPPIDLAHCCVQ